MTSPPKPAVSTSALASPSVRAAARLEPAAASAVDAVPARAAFVTLMQGFAWGGSEELWAAAAEEARAAGAEVLASVPPGLSSGRLEGLSRVGVRVEARPATPRRATLLRHAGRVAGRIRRAALPSDAGNFHDFGHLARFRPHVVCVSVGSAYDAACPEGLIGFLRSSGTPYVVIVQHAVDPERHVPERDRRRLGAVLGSASAVAFVSEGNRRLVERQIAAALPNAVVVRNPVNLKDASAVPWPTDAVRRVARLAVVARLDAAAKAQDLLLEAVAAERWRSRPWEMTFYGTGPDDEYLRRVAAHYGLGERVRFAGHVSDVREAWSRNELLVLPSRSEGTPLALVEAMLCGRPAVVTDVGGNAEWVEEGRTGFVADGVSARSVGDALERAWAARDDWPRIGAAAREAATALYDPHPGRRVLELCANAAATRGPAAGSVP